MPIIRLETYIEAPIETVFDLSRSVELHEKSTNHTKEKAIAGKMSGLLELNDEVTWRAKHLGFYQKLSIIISEFNRPFYFKDKMTTGIFKRFDHEHIFEEKDGITVATDIFNYTSPFGIFGVFADKLFLEKYMTNFLIKRNLVIKEESEKLRNNF